MMHLPVTLRSSFPHSTEVDDFASLLERGDKATARIFRAIPTDTAVLLGRVEKGMWRASAETMAYLEVKLREPSAALDYYSLDDVWLFPNEGLILFDKGMSLFGLSAIGFTSEDLSRRHLFSRVIGFTVDEAGNLFIDPATLDNTPVVEAPSFCSMHAGAGTYGHWFFDCVPPLFHARDFIQENLRIASRSLASWQEASIAALGLDSFIDLIDAPVVHFRKLIVPSFISIENTRSCGPLTRAACVAVRDGILLDESEPAPQRRLYLSRKYMDNRRRIDNESELEEFLAKRGFDVIYPEHLDLKTQIKLYSNAEVIVGPMGSANVNIAFAKPGCTLIELAAHDYMDPVFARLAVLSSCHYSVYQSKDVLRKGGYQNFSFHVDLAEIDAMLDFLSARSSPAEVITRGNEGIESMTAENAADPEKASPQWVSRSDVVNAFVALKGRVSYLEIGVSEGTTFFSVEAEQKVAVDPVFRFDHVDAASRNADARFFSMTSDDFFISVAPEFAKFDVIFLDGLHTFDQTLRDFHNALEYLEEDGVIVIDNVVPNSYEASITDMNRALELKQRQGSNDYSWMGDVYRLVYFIREFHPLLYLGTISNSHGQAVVWRNSKNSTFNKMYTAEQISTLPYETTIFQSNRMNPTSFSKILEYYVSSRSSAKRDSV